MNFADARVACCGGWIIVRVRIFVVKRSNRQTRLCEREALRRTRAARSEALESLNSEWFLQANYSHNSHCELGALSLWIKFLELFRMLVNLNKSEKIFLIIIKISDRFASLAAGFGSVCRQREGGRVQTIPSVDSVRRFSESLLWGSCGRSLRSKLLWKSLWKSLWKQEQNTKRCAR